MKTIEDFLNDAVKEKSEFSNDFKELLLEYKQGDCVRIFVESVIEHAMQEYASSRCEDQINDCYDFANGYHFANIDIYNGSEAINQIINTPNVVKKYI